jgi:hypothetical protein
VPALVKSPCIHGFNSYNQIGSNCSARTSIEFQSRNHPHSTKECAINDKPSSAFHMGMCIQRQRKRYHLYHALMVISHLFMLPPQLMLTNPATSYLKGKQVHRPLARSRSWRCGQKRTVSYTTSTPSCEHSLDHQGQQFPIWQCQQRLSWPDGQFPREQSGAYQHQPRVFH